MLLRIEDHDRTRSRPEFETALLSDLEWLGFLPDQPVTRQSDRETSYAEAHKKLETMGLVYACDCSRKDIETTQAQATDDVRYPGTCRSRLVDGQAEKGRRVQLDRLRVTFRDLRLGEQEQFPSEQAGDTLIRNRHGHWTYQFCVVVDDLEQGVDLVIRGEDLLSATGRQVQLGQLLGRQTPPLFLHHALITHPGGEKLSKSNRDTGIRDLRAAGWSVERVLGQAATVLGLTEGEPVDQAEIIARIRASARPL